MLGHVRLFIQLLGCAFVETCMRVWVEEIAATDSRMEKRRKQSLPGKQ